MAKRASALAFARPLVIALALGAAGACGTVAPSDPDVVTVHDEDVRRFWRAVDAALEAHGLALTAEAPAPTDSAWDQGLEWTLARTLQARYLDSASTALARFAGQRAMTAVVLARAVRRDWTRYRAVRQVAPALAGPHFGEGAREVQRRLHRWLPGAVFPEIHLVVGADGSGGTVHRGSIVLAVEKAARVEDHLQLWAHELAHAQQPRHGMNRVLNRALVEGGADLAATWLTGRPVRSRSYAWALAHEAHVREGFSQDAYTRRIGRWFGGESRPGWAADLGYFAGARILETGVAAAAGFPGDTAAALRAVLGWSDADRVLAESRWRVGPVARILAGSHRRMGLARADLAGPDSAEAVRLPPTDLAVLAEAAVTGPGGERFHARVDSRPDGTVRVARSNDPAPASLSPVLPDGPTDTTTWNWLRGHELHALLLFPETRLYDPAIVPAGPDTLALRWMLNGRDSLVVHYAARDTLPLGVEMGWVQPPVTVSLEGWGGGGADPPASVSLFRRAVFRQGPHTFTWEYTRVSLELAEQGDGGTVPPAGAATARR